MCKGWKEEEEEEVVDFKKKRILLCPKGGATQFVFVLCLADEEDVEKAYIFFFNQPDNRF